MKLNFVPPKPADVGTPLWRNMQIIRAMAEGIGSTVVDVDFGSTPTTDAQKSFEADWIKEESVLVATVRGNDVDASDRVVITVEVDRPRSATIYLNSSVALSGVVRVNVIGVL